MHTACGARNHVSRRPFNNVRCSVWKLITLIGTNEQKNRHGTHHDKKFNVNRLHVMVQKHIDFISGAFKVDTVLPCKGLSTRCINDNVEHLSFSYFWSEINWINPIIWEKIYQKWRKIKTLWDLNPYLPPPTDQQSGVLTITPQRQLWVGDTENLTVAFGHAWLALTEFIWFIEFSESNTK